MASLILPSRSMSRARNSLQVASQFLCSYRRAIYPFCYNLTFCALRPPYWFFLYRSEKLHIHVRSLFYQNRDYCTSSQVVEKNKIIGLF